MNKEYVGIDLHRRRSVIVRKNAEGEVVSKVHIVNDPVALALGRGIIDGVAASRCRSLIKRGPIPTLFFKKDQPSRRGKKAT